MRRRVLFSLFVFALFGVLVEGGLRLAGYQGQPDRTVSWSPEHVPPSPPFFPTLEVEGHPYRAARTPSQPHPWSSEKPANTLRIVALGGSAVHGYGFTRVGSWPDKVEERLVVDGADVEVLNLGAIAWSSQQLVMLVKEALALQPDAFVVYSGNNELLEWVGARQYLPEPELRRWVRSTTWARRLRTLRSYRWMAEALSERPGVWGQTDFRQAEPIPMVERAPITDADRAFAEGQLRHNLRRIVELAGDIPVVVSTVPLNLAYQPADTQDPCVEAQSEATGQADRLLQEGRRDEAFALAEAAFSACPDPMQAWHWGSALRRHGEVELAREWLERAMLLDASPNRAAPYLSEVVGDLDGVLLVDGAAAIAAMSEDGLVDFGQIYDHCHPTPEAHTVLASAIGEVLAEHFDGRLVEPPVAAEGHVDAWLGPAEFPLDPETERPGWYRVLEQERLKDAAAWNQQGVVAWHVLDGSCAEGRVPCLSDAVRAFRRALEDDPTLCVAHANLGRVFFAIDHPSAAEELEIAAACGDERSAWYLERLSRRR